MKEPIVKPGDQKPYDQKSCDASIELGDTGMGMPVFRAYQALRGIPVGAVLHVSSSHP
ncbi:MAG: hypothetical protein V3S64_12080 [bacterium]